MPDTGKKSKTALSRHDRRRIAGSVATVVLLLTAAAAAWFFRDSLRAPEQITAALVKPETLTGFPYEAGSGQAFCAAGQGLAVTTSAGFELFAADGELAAAQVLGLETPACCACSAYAVFYDLGGRSCVLADFDGETAELSVDGDILSVTVSEDGYLAVTTRCTGYRGVVTVYNPRHEAVYQWFSSSAWVLSAWVSPDSRRLAVLSYTAAGSRVDLLSLSSETPLGSFSASDTVLLDLRWMSGKSLVAYSGEQALFFDSEGSWKGTYSFDGRYLTGCALGGDGFVAFAVSQYRSGTAGTLVTLDAGAAVLGTAELKSELLSLDAHGGELLALCADGASLYSSSLKRKGGTDDVAGYKTALLRARGSALLLASNYAEVFKF